MTKRCLDEAILQAYIDGELPPEKSAEAAAHAAACEACAAALAAAAAEVSFFASAFAPDEALSVPTEVLRSRINAAVARLDAGGEAARPGRTGRGFAGFFAPLAALFNFSPQGAAAFATLAALLALGAVYFTSQRAQRAPSKSGDAPQVARVAQTSDAPPAATATHDGEEVSPAPNTNKGTAATATTPVRFDRAPRRAATGNGGASPRRDATPKEEVLAGEKEYRTAIASLEKTIKLGGDESLKPALRAQYERNLALLDSAITQTRQVAAQNPKDRDAVGFLMSAYQSKLELLTKVADQAQVAALGR
ncbi:MAG TPA: zf-HC2 domain-containing protein [Pyrinomonadaceae bacterium]|jgi:anti-sigma factor RsiW